jgi:hypothetical protein
MVPLLFDLPISTNQRTTTCRPVVDEERNRNLIPETHYLRSKIPDHEDRFIEYPGALGLCGFAGLQAACASQDVRINEGLHHHGVILLPPRSRLREGLVAHFEQQQQRYLAGSRLASIFAEPMTDNLEKAIRYAFKAVESGRLDYDDSFVVLPRALSEVS